MTRLGDALYRLILRMFPRTFRQHHGDAMLEQFRAQRAALGGRPVAIAGLWLRAMFDALRHGIAQRFEERTRRSVLRSVGDWAGDLRKSVRTLRRQPAFTLTAIATLTLGIGANAAVFALAWHTSFRSLPYPEPDRLIRVFESNPARNQPVSDLSPASLAAWAQRAKTLEAVGDFGRSRVIFPLDDNGELARNQSLSPGVLAALGIRPVLGRTVLTEAERQPDEVLISYEYWQRRFGGDPGVINRLHRFADVADEPERIIGVMPPGFQFLEAADIWSINFSYSHNQTFGRNYRATRQDSMLARIRPGHTLAEARAELERISADLAREYPDTHAGWTPVVRTLHETVVGKFSTMAVLLVAAAGAVFFIACTNIAGLLLMRAAGRSQEVQLRLALGGTRWRVVRLWLLEGLVVSVVSLGAGIAAARWLVKVLAVMAPASLPRLDQVTISWPVIVVGALGAIGFVVVYALAPLAAGVMNANRLALKRGDGMRTVSHGGRWRGILLGTQAALAVVLLSGAVLLTAALQRLHDQPLGFNPQGVLSMRVTPHYPGTRRPWAEAAEYGRMLEERLKAYPGVLHAAITTGVPLEDIRIPAVFRVDGDTRQQPWGAIHHSASPGYLKTIGLGLVDGRWFTEDDAFTAEQLNFGFQIGYADQVAVITESMARTLWPGQSAVGQRLLSLDGDPRPKRVIGVVKDFRFLGPDEVPTFRLFVPWRQGPGASTIAILVKTAGDPRALAAAVGAIAKDIRPSTGLHAARTLEDLYRASSADTSFAASLVGGFSLLALLLTGVGVFGVVGYSIATRRRELAVRMALGAGRAHISTTAAAAGFMPVVIGTGVGLVAALSCVRFVRGLLFEVNPLSPTHYVLAGAVLLVVAAVASAAPLRRLLAIDPAESLRSE
jgi:predicted permease